MKYEDTRKRLTAAQALLLEPTTTREKFSHVTALIKGIHPKADLMLGETERALSTIEKAYNLQVIDLAADNLPENTEEEKRRKKMILFFVRSWRQLESEVARVSKEMQEAQNSNTTVEKASHWGKIFGVVKGPLALITLAAIGLGAMQVTSVQITIENRGCGTLYAGGGMPISIPGLSLPKGAIPSGSSALATLPPLTVAIDGTSDDALKLRALSLTMDFQLPSNIKSVTFDGISLIGKQTQVRLSESKEHALVLSCG